MSKKFKNPQVKETSRSPHKTNDNPVAENQYEGKSYRSQGSHTPLPTEKQVGETESD